MCQSQRHAHRERVRSSGAVASLRGRIGERTQFLLLFVSDDGRGNACKLGRVGKKTSDGFDVAEADWEFRVPGDLLGTHKAGCRRSSSHLKRRGVDSGAQARREKILMTIHDWTQPKINVSK